MNIKTRRTCTASEPKHVPFPGMKITIHRGTHEIGGCVTEYEHDGYRLFVDYGEQLPGAPKSESLEIEGLTKGDLSKTALLITHYHGDHIGRIADIPTEIPVYMGKVAVAIQRILSNHLKGVDPKQNAILDRLDSVNEIQPGHEFSFGPFKIMPITVDHSAFDAYAFCIDADGVSVFHTGDFRTHGFRSGKMPKLIERYVGKVDYVVCEGTNVGRPTSASLKEWELQKQFENDFKENKFNIVYVSSTNIDRLFSLYHTALNAGRPLYVDGYQKQVMDTVIENERMWTKSSLYKYGKYEPIPLQYEKNGFRYTPEFEDFLNIKGCVLVARTTPKFNELIQHLPENETQTYLSMWNGYVDANKEAYNKDLADALGTGYLYRHTSGHCDMEDLDALFYLLSPRAIIPIHTDDPKAFADYFCDKWPVMQLSDGETFLTQDN